MRFFGRESSSDQFLSFSQKLLDGAYDGQDYGTVKSRRVVDKFETLLQSFSEDDLSVPDEIFEMGCRLLRSKYKMVLEKRHELISLCAKVSPFDDEKALELFDAGKEALYSLSYRDWSFSNKEALHLVDATVADKPQAALEALLEIASDPALEVVQPFAASTFSQLLVANLPLLQDPAQKTLRDTVVRRGLAFVSTSSVRLTEGDDPLDIDTAERRDYVAKLLFAMTEKDPEARGKVLEALLPVFTLPKLCVLAAADPELSKFRQGRHFYNGLLGGVENQETLRKADQTLQGLAGVQGILPNGEILVVSGKGGTKNGDAPIVACSVSGREDLRFVLPSNREKKVGAEKLMTDQRIGLVNAAAFIHYAAQLTQLPPDAFSPVLPVLQAKLAAPGAASDPA